MKLKASSVKHIISEMTLSMNFTCVSKMQIIWRALITYLNNTLKAGKSVNIKKFGAFTFDIQTELPKISQRRITAESSRDADVKERKHIHKLRYV